MCQKVCPTEAIDYEQKDQILEYKVGNIILATGYDLIRSSANSTIWLWQIAECNHKS